MNKLQQDLEKWGKEVCQGCRQLIKEGKTDQDFYVFQTPLPNKSPEVLLVGINPGGEKTYQKQVSEHRKGSHRETIKDLAQGTNIYKDKVNNPYQSKALARIESLSKLIEEDKVIGINVCYFNTKNVHSISLELLDFCANKTSELIDIIKPKRIVFLTNKEATLKLVGVKNIKPVEAYVKEGLWQDRKVYALPNHGYYRAYSYANAEKISAILDGYLK